MTEILDAVSSKIWWFSAIVVALLINVLSAYVKPGLDLLFSKVSQSHAARNHQRSLQREAEIARLKADPLARISLGIEAIQSLSLSVFFLLALVGMLAVITSARAADLVLALRALSGSSRWIAVGLLLASTLVLILGLATGAAGLSEWSRYWRLRRLVRDSTTAIPAAAASNPSMEPPR